MDDTDKCPNCGGEMHHSDDMDDPFTGSSNDTTPFRQCEDCGYLICDTADED